MESDEEDSYLSSSPREMSLPALLKGEGLSDAQVESCLERLSRSLITTRHGASSPL